ncbi:hypothetical protein [Xylanimonas protaetiae]|uniref:Uncharacterized protein n=1 Tax=Xylanimonas protaetiae TaxID=2509457 RepID=A0A4P6F197_9MICO|nr:hypothetical protein [Xylanimonas protaetiae]QAY69540.1 hypothetical protein ET471_05355 [Xylanimonas protaetiae]
MTATTLATERPTTRAVPRVSQGGVLAVVRLHLVNRMQLVWQPLMIFGFIFAVNAAIWAIVSSATSASAAGISEGTLWSGGTSFVLVWQLMVAVQAMNRTFAFALGMGATRRDYYLGTVTALTLTSACWAVLIGVLGAVEDATDGWGLGGHLFSVTYFGDDGPVARAWYFFLLAIFFAFLGTVAGALFVRWHTWGVLAFSATLTVLLLGALAWLLVGHGWHDFAGFLSRLGFAGSYPLLLVPTVLSGVLGWLALRGATAKSG